MEPEEALYCFCQNIHGLRVCRGLSQKEMAKRLGISVKSLRRIESGDVSRRTSCKILFAAQDAFGIPAGELFRKNYLWDRPKT